MPTLGETLSYRVIEAIADREGVPSEDLQPPLYEVVDLEALDELFAPTPKGTPRGDGQVSFFYRGYEVTVTSDNEITIREATD